MDLPNQEGKRPLEMERYSIEGQQKKKEILQRPNSYCEADRFNQKLERDFHHRRDSKSRKSHKNRRSSKKKKHRKSKGEQLVSNHNS